MSVSLRAKRSNLIFLAAALYHLSSAHAGERELYRKNWELPKDEHRAIQDVLQHMEPLWDKKEYEKWVNRAFTRVLSEPEVLIGNSTSHALILQKIRELPASDRDFFFGKLGRFSRKAREEKLALDLEGSDFFKRYWMTDEGLTDFSTRLKNALDQGDYFEAKRMSEFAMRDVKRLAEMPQTMRGLLFFALSFTGQSTALKRAFELAKEGQTDRLYFSDRISCSLADAEKALGVAATKNGGLFPVSFDRDFLAGSPLITGNTLAVASAAGVLRVFEMGKPLSTMKTIRFDARLYSFAPFSKGQFVAVTGPNTLRAVVNGPDHLVPTSTLKLESDDPLYAPIQVFPDGEHFAVASISLGLVVGRLVDGQLKEVARTASFASHPDTPAISPDGRHVVIGLEDGFRIFRWADEKLQLVKEVKTPRRNELPLFSPDGKYLFVLSSKLYAGKITTVRMSGETPEKLEDFEVGDRGDNSLYLLPDGRHLAALSRGSKTLVLFQITEKGLEKTATESFVSPPHALTASFDGKQVAVLTESGVTLGRVNAGAFQKMGELSIDISYWAKDSKRAAFFPDGKHLAIPVVDGRLLVARVTENGLAWTNELSFRAIDHPPLFSSDGKHMVLGSSHYSHVLPSALLLSEFARPNLKCETGFSPAKKDGGH